jgi:hypothetical protein
LLEFVDFFGRRVFLVEEREKHIVEEHAEVVQYLVRLSEVIKSPDLIKGSVYDKQIFLFYKFYEDIFAGKYLVVVVKYNEKNLILTCYITDKIKGGRIRWRKG